MVLEPWAQTAFSIIPTAIITVIIGVLVWSVYFIIKEKRKSSSVNSNIIAGSNLYIRVFGTDIKKRTVNKVLLILGALPLLVYPMAMMANMMAIAALFMSENISSTILMLLFVIFTSSYLLTYLTCFVLYFKKRDETILISVIPLIHIAVILLILN